MKILLVISNYNEQDSLRQTLADIIENATIKADVIVIDNASVDASLEIAKEFNVDYLVHPVNTGGSAGVIKTSLMYASKYNYDIYCHMDGDNQHNAEYLKQLLIPIENKKANIVIGSRFINKEGFQSFYFRRIGIRLFSKIMSVITKRRITDLTSGFRAYDRKAINFFAVKYKHELEACVQMMYIAHKAGLKIIEVPVVMNFRKTGKSEFNLIRSVKFPVYAFISLLGTSLQKKI